MSAVPAEGGFDLLVGLGSDPVLVWVVRSFLALVFVRALVAKLRSPAHFVSAIRGYELLPTALSGLVAVFLLAAELAVVPALLVPALARGACLGAGALSLLYAGAMGINLPCTSGCSPATCSTWPWPGWGPPPRACVPWPGWTA